MALTEIDRHLLKRCVAEEPGAWKDFVDRFIGLFVHVINHTAHARSARLSSADIDDLCAEIFLALVADDYAVLRRFLGRSSLATYLTVVARRITVHEMSRRRMVDSLGGLSNSSASLSTVADTSAEEELRIENQEMIESLLKDLPDHEAKIVREFHLEGLSYQEISDRNGVPANSIGPTLTRARTILKHRNPS